MAIRASDRVTLAVLPAPSYVRLYYLLQASNLAAPTKPTTNPPASPWTVTEPTYTEGSTQTLYTTMITVYGTAGFEYGDVQKSSSYEAAKVAYNKAAAAQAAASTAATLASGAVTFSASNPTAGDAAGKPTGALWTVVASNQIISYWELTSLGWVQRPLSTTVIPQINIGTGTFGTLAGVRLAADAMDGKTITGALIRTAASGQRMQFDTNGLRGFAASGVEIARLSLLGTGLTLTADSDQSAAKAFLAISKTEGAYLALDDYARENSVIIRSLPGQCGAEFSGRRAGDVNGRVVINANSASVEAERFVNNTGALSAPYASAAGEFSTGVTVAAGGSLSYGISFPSSRFTQPPHVFVSTESGRFSMFVASVTATGFTIGVNNWSPGAAAAGVRLRWHAVQMLKTGATG